MGLPEDWQRTLKRNEITDKSRTAAHCTQNLSSDGAAGSLEGFFFFIHYGVITNKCACWRRWRSSCRSLTTMATDTFGLSMGTTSTITVISRLGAAKRLGDNRTFLVALGPLLMVPRGTVVVHGCKKDETRLRAKKDRENEDTEVEKHAWEGINSVKSVDMSQDSRLPGVLTHAILGMGL
jgi:hypothetical protein